MEWGNRRLNRARSGRGTVTVAAGIDANDEITLSALDALDRSPDGIGSGRSETILTDRFVDALDRVMFEQLQNTDVLSRSSAATKLSLEDLPRLGERGGQHPVAIDRRVIQRRRLAL